MNNDEKIIKLKQQIEGKRNKLGNLKRFTPITNCILELDGITTNIQILPKEKLALLLVKLNLFKMSMENLNMSLDEIIINGYNIGDWMSDILAKIDIISYKEEEQKLKTMESKLVELLSKEKKTELAIDEIEKML
jgi:hypothetical protein